MGLVLLFLVLRVVHGVEKRSSRRRLDKAMKQAEKQKEEEVSRARAEGAAAERERAEAEAAAREAAQTQAQAQAQAQAQVQSATCAAQEAVEAQNTLAEEAAPVDAAEAAETTIGG